MLFYAKSFFTISKQFSISILFNCKKAFLFLALQFKQTVLIQIIQYRISIVLFYAQLNVKTVILQTIQFNTKTDLFRTIRFSISTPFKCQNSSILNNSVPHKYAV